MKSKITKKKSPVFRFLLILQLNQVCFDERSYLVLQVHIMANGEKVIKNGSFLLCLALPKAEPSNRNSSMYEGRKI